MAGFNVNNDDVINLTAKLEKISKSAFPSAVRNTLNNAAFDMKTKGLLNSANKNFSTVRSPSFFRKFSRFEKAEGFNVNKMSSRVGFVDNNDPAIKKVVAGLQKHEIGGLIDDGARYLKDSRTSGSYSKRVRRANYYNKAKVITGRNKGAGGTRKSKFVARMFRAHKEDKPMFLNSAKGNILVKVASISRSKDGVKSRLKFLMMSRSKTPVRISRNGFVTDAGMDQRKKLPKYYKKNAEYQFSKILNKKR